MAPGNPRRSSPSPAWCRRREARSLHGAPIDALPSEQIVRLGISHVPEGRELFPELTVLENLKMGAYTRT